MRSAKETVDEGTESYWKSVLLMSGILENIWKGKIKIKI